MTKRRPPAEPPAPPAERPQYLQQRKGRFYWEPPARLRRSHGLKVVALGADQPTAWAAAAKLNRELAGLDPGAAAPGTVRWIFDQFFASEKFKGSDKTRGLAAHTQRDYRWLAKTLCALRLAERELGDYPARAIKARHADRIHALLTEARGAHVAHYVCRVARRVWKWSGRREFVDQHPNPWSGMELPQLQARRQRWQPDQVAAVVAKAAELGWHSVGLATRLGYWLGHRKIDILALTWSAIDRGEHMTSKTGVVLPIVPEAYPELDAALREAREANKARQVPAVRVVVHDFNGRAWSEYEFTRIFRELADAAGIPDDLQFRDLRATALTEIEDAGAGDIAATTHSGHLTPAMRRRYARRTPQQFQAAARARLAARKGEE